MVLHWLFPLLFCGCDRAGADDLLKGQTNTAMTFYGLAVDQEHRPIAGVQFEIIVDSFPKDWTFETRGKPNDRATLRIATDEQGRFELRLTGGLIFVQPEIPAGFRHLTPLFGTQRNTTYRLINLGDLWHKSDPANPAVYVFVRDGVKEVSALPCRGGFDSGGGTVWRKNNPAWPKKPSLTDVVYKPPTTQPATTQ